MPRITDDTARRIRDAREAQDARERGERLTWQAGDVAFACSGCRDGLPTRPCAITGAPQHRGPDHTFPCRAVK